jgi:hypothetical protein
MNSNGHLVGDNVGEGRLAETRRAHEKDVIERFVTSSRGANRNVEILPNRVLSDVVREALRAKAGLTDDVVRSRSGAHRSGAILRWFHDASRASDRLITSSIVLVDSTKLDETALRASACL